MMVVDGVKLDWEDGLTATNLGGTQFERKQQMKNE